MYNYNFKTLDKNKFWWNKALDVVVQKYGNLEIDVDKLYEKYHKELLEEYQFLIKKDVFVSDEEILHPYIVFGDDSMYANEINRYISKKYGKYEDKVYIILDEYSYVLQAEFIKEYENYEKKMEKENLKHQHSYDEIKPLSEKLAKELGYNKVPEEEVYNNLKKYLNDNLYNVKETLGNANYFENVKDLEEYISKKLSNNKYNKEDLKVLTDLNDKEVDYLILKENGDYLYKPWKLDSNEDYYYLKDNDMYYTLMEMENDVENEKELLDKKREAYLISPEDVYPFYNDKALNKLTSYQKAYNDLKENGYYKGDKISILNISNPIFEMSVPLEDEIYDIIYETIKKNKRLFNEQNLLHQKELLKQNIKRR